MCFFYLEWRVQNEANSTDGAHVCDRSVCGVCFRPVGKQGGDGPRLRTDGRWACGQCAQDGSRCRHGAWRRSSCDALGGGHHTRVVTDDNARAYTASGAHARNEDPGRVQGLRGAASRRNGCSRQRARRQGIADASPRPVRRVSKMNTPPQEID